MRYFKEVLSRGVLLPLLTGLKIAQFMGYVGIGIERPLTQIIHKSCRTYHISSYSSFFPRIKSTKEYKIKFFFKILKF